MAVLSNGLETIEIGAIAWRVILNNNFTMLYTQSQIDTYLGNKADKATTLNGYGITDAYTKTESDTNLNTHNSNISAHNLNGRTSDISFSDNTKGIVLADRSDGNNYRIYVNNGTLSVEIV